MLENVFHRILQTMFGSGANISSSNPMPVTSETSLANGVATGGGLTTLDDTLKGWQVNIWEDALVEILDVSTGISYTREIDSNTATQLDFTTNPLPAAVVAGDSYTIKRVVSPLNPISRADQFNVAGYLADADILGADLAPLNSPSNFRVGAAFSAGGILSVDLTQGGVTVTFQCQGGVALNINSSYRFSLMVNAGDTINFNYSVNATILSFKVFEIPAAAE